MCDRNEGDAIERFSGALQAYLEWMPIRNKPNTNTGSLTTPGSLTQVIEWGDLATIVTFDTRMSYRSEEPTGQFRFEPYSRFAETYPDFTQYSEEGSAEREALLEFTAQQRELQNSENFTMAGKFTQV